MSGFSNALAVLTRRQDVAEITEVSPGVFHVVDDVAASFTGNATEVEAWLNAGLDDADSAEETVGG